MLFFDEIWLWKGLACKDVDAGRACFSLMSLMSMFIIRYLVIKLRAEDIKIGAHTELEDVSLGRYSFFGMFICHCVGGLAHASA